MAQPTLTFRAHHFLCTLGFKGLGYSPDYVTNYKHITKQLRSPGGEDIPIQVVKGTDAICSPCPNKVGALCHYQAKIDHLDQAHGQVLSIKPGDELTWGQAKKRIQGNISIETFHQICGPCSWKRLGICEEALLQLHQQAL